MSMILNTLKKKYEAEIEEAKMNIRIMLNNPTSIPEHSEFLVELDKHLNKIAEAEDKMGAINNHFGSGEKQMLVEDKDAQMTFKNL